MKDLTLPDAIRDRDALASRTEVLNKVKALSMLPGDTYLTGEMVANYYDVSVDVIRQAVVRNRDEIAPDGYRVLSRSEFESEIGSLSNMDPRSRSIALFSRRAILRVGMLLRDSEVAKAVRTALLDSEQRTTTPAERMALAVLEAQSIIAEKDSRIAELEPKARTFDTFLNSTGDYSLNEAAKVLSRDHNVLTGERRLLASMVAWGWVYRDGKNKPIPYQAHIDNGRLKAKARFHYHPETGEVVVDAPQVRITAKGLEASLARLTANTLELTS